MQQEYEKISDQVKDIVSNLNEIPTLPLIAHKVIAYLNSSRSGAKEIANLIRNDQALTSKVLKLVNSAYFGLPKKVDDIMRAIVLLGFNNILQIVMNLSVMKVFGKGNEEFDRSGFWKHSIAVAICAQRIARHLKLREEGTAYTAGLLHDIGKIIFDNYFHEAYMGALTYAEVNKIPIYEVEQDILGITHSFAGNLLLLKWNIPLSLRETVKYHHFDQHLLQKITIQNSRLVQIVRLANLYVASLEIGASGYPDPPIIDDEEYDALKLSRRALENERFNLEIEVEQSATFLDVWE